MEGSVEGLRCAVAVLPSLGRHHFCAPTSYVSQATCGTSGTLMMGVPRPTPRAPRPVATISRSTFVKAGVEVAPASGVGGGRSAQHRSGGREGKGGRPVNTRRDTWRTLGTGMMRAVCACILGRGFEPFVRRLFSETPPAEMQERLLHDMRERASEFYRGEVWPLKHVFGVLSRFVVGTTGGAGLKGKSGTPSVVSTWMNHEGAICCSCVGRSAHVGRVRVSSSADSPCAHARTFEAAVSRLCWRMRVTVPMFRKQVPSVFDGDDATGGADNAATTAYATEDWDAEGPVEVFRAGQSVVAVVMSGVGSHQVVAPVLCSRKSTSCSFCDTAAGFSCVHALRCRSISRGTGGAADALVKKCGSDDVDAARSKLPISVFNCPRSVKVDIEVCGLMQQGKALVLAAPEKCPTCLSADNKGQIKVDTGEVLCTMGFCRMELHSFYCSGKECCRRIYPDGRDNCVVILSSSSASTAVLLRDMAREVTTGGSTFGACFRRWHNKYLDLRDSGTYPAMMSISPKSRQTVSSMFFLGLRLMCRDPPLWAFRCSDCQDEEGRFRVVTADGIWMGFLTRLASGQYQHPSQPCASVKARVEAASFHLSEWARRYLRMALKQPSKVVVIKAGQLRSAMRALAFLCPAALPNVTESLSESKKECLQHLVAMLGSVWSLQHACVSLCDGIVVFIKKLLGPRSTLSADAIVQHRQTLQQLGEWKAGVLRPNFSGDVVGDDVGAAAPAPLLVGHGDGDHPPAHGGAVGDGHIAGAAAPAPAPAPENPGVGGRAGAEVGGVVAGGGHAEGAGVPAPAAAGAGAVAGAAIGGAAVGGGPVAGAGAPAPAAAAVGGDFGAPAAGQVLRGPIGAAVAGGEGVDPAARREQNIGHRQNRAGVDAPAFALPLGARRARAPAASARQRHLDRSTSEPGESRCLLPAVADLGVTLHKDVASFCLALAVDPVVNTYKMRHCQALSSLSGLLKAESAMQQLNELFKNCSDSVDAHPGLPDAEVQMSLLLVEHRMLFSFLAAISSSVTVFESLRRKVADVLSSLRVVVEDYYSTALDPDGSAAAFCERWGDPRVSPEQLRRRFKLDFPDASDDPLLTGAFFPGLFMCRPGAFAATDPPELGTCAKNYEEVHKHFSPGTFTICCACAHPKVIGFVVLDKREGPPSLLNAIISYFALLPQFVVYDFGCGALRSALGKLPFFIASVVLVSDLFHIVNHLCSDALHPRSYSGLDGSNTVAHEQRNAPINLMRRSLRACGQDEYIAIMQVENVMYNIMAHARSSSPCRLPEDYNYRKYYFSRNPCMCGCGYSPPPPLVPPPTEVPDFSTEVDPLGVGEWVEGDDW